MEIHKLHSLMNEEGIEHTFMPRTIDAGVPVNAGFQIFVMEANEHFISAIEGAGSYGFGGWDHGLLGTNEKDGDLIEIWNGKDGLIGYLTAEEALVLIKEEMQKWSK